MSWRYEYICEWGITHRNVKRDMYMRKRDLQKRPIQLSHIFMTYHLWHVLYVILYDTSNILFSKCHMSMTYHVLDDISHMTYLMTHRTCHFVMNIWSQMTYHIWHTWWHIKHVISYMSYLHDMSYVHVLHTIRKQLHTVRKQPPLQKSYTQKQRVARLFSFCAQYSFLKAVSTDNATRPKSTKSRSSNFSVHI